MDPVQLAAVVVIPSMLSVELGISVALLKLVLGVVIGNLFDLNADTLWLVFAGRHVVRQMPPLGHAGDRCRPTRNPLAGLRACCPMDAGVPGGSGHALAPDDEQAPRESVIRFRFRVPRGSSPTEGRRP